MTLAETDAAVKAYFSKLEPATKKTLLHDTTGPEAGADVGIIAAVIPDPNHPEFSVYWLRDACLVYHPWLNELTVLGDSSLRPQLDDVVHALTRTQQVVSLAGNVFTGGIDEAVFGVKLQKILDVKTRIGSPAADGPPFRVDNLIKFAEWLLKPEQKNGTWVADVLWPVINLDLQWISSHWNQSSWDLWWPPVWGGSYWTASLQYRALRGGARLGRAIGRDNNVAEYDAHAAMVLDYMQTFWNEKEEFMTETTVTDVKKGRSGYGSAPLTVSVYNFDPSLGCDDATFQPCSPRALSSLKVVGDRFKAFFPISQNFTDKQPPYYGFFTEDEFIGGHPQFFASFNSAEQLYDALITWDKIGHIEVTPVSLKFWKQFDSRVSVMRYRKGSDGYKVLTEYARNWANKIVLQLEKGTPSDYVLVECVDKNTGGPYGPRGMIRSLAAALGVIDAYHGLVPPNWGHPIPGSKVSPNEIPAARPPRVAQSDSCHSSQDVYRQQSQKLHGYRYSQGGF
ncbi:Six-hairpin glycosidase-like protein [Russula ochroleuca]|jgi:glucoamylase|uniref:1,4-alpha-D-glucan glucohydrolase n=1 Tax=Russula ochroleuca TaxID=152965 RepID=A0A9P5MR22_9AGAM|nr:Six-hairpin glycosidase-like protein [Russula ochroleuca]